MGSMEFEEKIAIVTVCSIIIITLLFLASISAI